MTGALYKGETPALTDLLGGQIEMGLFSVFCCQELSALRQAHAHCRYRRKAEWPHCQMCRRLPSEGHNEMSYGESWYAFLAPANVPPEITGRLSMAIKAFLDNPVGRKYLEDMDVIINWTNGNAFAPQMRTPRTWRLGAGWSIAPGVVIEQ
ncbi:tripartite tricarboxylate transporter substrate-binding protein [Cupriavidus basilensis]